VAGSCEHCKEPSRSIKSGYFINHMGENWLLKEDCAPRLLVSQSVSQLVNYLVALIWCAFFQKESSKKLTGIPGFLNSEFNFSAHSLTSV
jgi:hypothetical protein